MSDIYMFNDHLIMISKNKIPQEHKHLAFHIIISMNKEIEWNIQGKVIKCKGICINSNVSHSTNSSNIEAITVFFLPFSSYVISIQEKYLKGSAYSILDENIINEVCCLYKKNKNNEELFNLEFLSTCGIEAIKEYNCDSRVKEIITYIKNIATIDNSIMNQLSRLVYLSQSRLSHIFKQQTGITLHSYLAFEKLHKTHQYYIEGKTLTEACLLAGFSSSSHFSATCKRMFGMSIREIYKR